MLKFHVMYHSEHSLVHDMATRVLYHKKAGSHAGVTSTIHAAVIISIAAELE